MSRLLEGFVAANKLSNSTSLADHRFGGIQKVWGDNVTAGNSTEKILFRKTKKNSSTQNIYTKLTKKKMQLRPHPLKRIQEGVIH